MCSSDLLRLLKAGPDICSIAWAAGALERPSPLTLILCLSLGKVGCSTMRASVCRYPYAKVSGISDGKKTSYLGFWIATVSPWLRLPSPVLLLASAGLVLLFGN